MGKNKKPTTKEKINTKAPVIIANVERLTRLSKSILGSEEKFTSLHFKKTLKVIAKPDKKMSMPVIPPTSKIGEFLIFSNHLFEGNKPSLKANTLTTTAKNIKRTPIKIPVSKINKELKLSTADPNFIERFNKVIYPMPEIVDMKIPGYKNSHLGLYSSIKRKCLQPSLQGLK